MNRSLHHLLMAGVIAVFVGCGTVPTPAPSQIPAGSPMPFATDAWAVLRRPLLQPPSMPCEPAAGRIVSPQFGPAFGPGQVYPVGAGIERARLLVSPASKRDEGWALKILWVAPAGFVGRVLIRGVSTSGGLIRFSLGSLIPDGELRIEWKRGTADDAWRESDAWREAASYTWVTAPGCHQWQVDTESGSTPIVFDVEMEA